jgi:Fe-S cluster biogenesis protein NfuA
MLGFPQGSILRTLIERSMIMREEVQAALDMVRPQLQADGGDAEIVDISEDGIVKLRLMGACGGCPMSQMTLKMGIERILKERVPAVKSVEAVQ